MLARITTRGLMAALNNPDPSRPPDPPWAERARSAHANAIENLAVFAPLVLMCAMTGRAARRRCSRPSSIWVPGWFTTWSTPPAFPWFARSLSWPASRRRSRSLLHCSDTRANPTHLRFTCPLTSEVTMKSTPGNILDTIGNTSLVPLRNVVPKNGARLFVKLESQNPTGSMKDRIALEMIEAPERDGRLKPGGAVVEYTGGSTGVSLALVCAVKRHPLHLVSSDAFSKQKLDHMRLLGAKLTLVPSDNGKQTEKLTKDMIREAHRIAGETGAYITAQMENTDQLNAYTKMADEIWEQTGGRLDGFVQSVGTAASLRGISRRLREHDARIRIAGVEPAESAVLSGGPTGAHKIDGIGAGYVVPLWRDGIADELERVSTEEARAMAFRLAAEEGLFCGTSTGANVTGALRLAERLGPDATIVTIMCDTGMKYLKSFAPTTG
ncbi:pyridoxal-phosphate dependent enzyme [Burkholderia cepacia]